MNENWLEENKRPADVYRALENQLTRLASMVSLAVTRSIWSLAERNAEAARQVIAGEEAVDLLADEINDACLNAIARFQPLGADLRLVTSAMLMARDLERLGDYGENAAKDTLKLLNQPVLKPIIDLPRMAGLVASMLDRAMKALANRDGDEAMAVFAMDDQVDDLEHAILIELASIMAQRPETLEQSSRLMEVTRMVERAGDHCTNVAEHVCYIVTGHRVRASEHRRPRELRS